MREKIINKVKRLSNKELVNLISIINFDDWNDFKSLLKETKYDPSTKSNYKDPIVFIVKNHKDKIIELLDTFLYEDLFNKKDLEKIKKYVLEDVRDPYMDI